MLSASGYCFKLLVEEIFSFIIHYLFYICREIHTDEAVVLHYTYAKFSDLTSRRDRCRCKPTEEDLKRCFMLPFDRNVSSI